MLDRFRVDGRVVIVTGGSGLLGSTHCQVLGEAGGRIVVADIRADEGEQVATQVQERTGAEAMAVATDVSDPGSVDSMVQQVIDRFGQIDILVNNAALDPKFDQASQAEHHHSFEAFPLLMWQEALRVNITGMFLCAQAVTPPMLERGRGVIVNIVSTYGMVGPDQRIYQKEGHPKQYKPVTYSVTKAAALGLTRYLATYFAGQGIRVNALTPGGVFAEHDDDFVRSYSARTVLGRMAAREEVSTALLFLVSDASSYMTGANLVVDGGWTAW